MTYFDDLPKKFNEVTIYDYEEIDTSGFLAAAEGVKDLFNLFGSSAFIPVQNDMAGNIKKIRAAQEKLGPDHGKSLQKIVLSEVKENKKDATQGLLWLTRGLRFTLEGMKRNITHKDEEVNKSFTKAYTETLAKYHNMFVRPVFKLAMAACPYRKDLYAKLGSPLELVEVQLAAWLEGLEKCVVIIEKFLDSGNYAKGL